MQDREMRQGKQEIRNKENRKKKLRDMGGMSNARLVEFKRREYGEWRGGNI